MPGDYDSTARALALSASPASPPIVNYEPRRTSWLRSNSNMSFGRSQSPYDHSHLGFRDRFIDVVDKLHRRATKTVEKMSLLQKIAAGLFILVAVVLGILFFVYYETFFAWLEPFAKKWRNLRGGWLIIWALTFVTAFPPVIGYSTCVTLAGFLYGFPNGWFVVATANIAGSLCSFLVSRTILSSFVHRLVANDPRFAAFSLVLKHEGLKLLVMIRLCPLPYSLSNGAMSTIQSIQPLAFTLATALASPKLMIHVFIGSRLAAIISSGDKMDTMTRVINYASIIGGMILGAVTGYLIYQRTVARSQQLEAEERNKIGRRVHSLSHPDEFSDDLGTYEEQLGAEDDDIDFLDSGVEGGQYRDDSDEGINSDFRYGDEEMEGSIGMNKQWPKR